MKKESALHNFDQYQNEVSPFIKTSDFKSITKNEGPSYYGILPHSKQPVSL